MSTSLPADATSGTTTASADDTALKHIVATGPAFPLTTGTGLATSTGPTASTSSATAATTITPPLTPPPSIDVTTLKHPTTTTALPGLATFAGLAATTSAPARPASSLAPTTPHTGTLTAATLTTPSLPKPSITAAITPAVIPAVVPAPSDPSADPVSVSPFEGVANFLANVLLAVGGMNPADPMPSPGNPVQLLFFALASGLEKSFDPAPPAGTPTVSAADPETGTVTGSLGFATDPSGDLTFTAPATSSGGGTVTVFADGSYSYTPTSAQRQDAGVNATDAFTATVHDGLSTNSVTVTVPVSPPQVTATIAVGDQPVGVAVSPNGTHVYVTNLAGNSVSVVNTATNTVTATIPVGSGPGGVAVRPNGALVY
ncbi:MAG TPA: Ig-like domain-containing protein, partial [Mycobacterium sp.]|nr:Ig-like domain-containing protein [Mycobacterium sp.]